MNPFRRRRALLLSTAAAAAILSGAGSALLGLCGPFTDVSDVTFCPFVLEIFYLGITTGTTPTTYDPTSSVTRLQMAAFLSRTVDRVLLRGSRRAALNQFWTTQNATVLGLTTVGSGPGPELLQSDGADVWVANVGDNTVSRVRASDGKLLEAWTGASSALGVLVAMGRVLVTGDNSPGQLYMIDPSQAAGAVTTAASNLGGGPQGIAFDGARVWTANVGGSVSIVTPGATTPWTVTTVTTGFTEPIGALYDGANVWVTDITAGTLLKLDSAGAILQTVTVGTSPDFPVFDGTNIWVPNFSSNSVSVVRASSGAVLQILTGNGLSGPEAAAFDGQRVLVTNFSGNSVSLWKAADLTALGSFPTGSGTFPLGACSDGVNFWIALEGVGKLARF
jgi:DNA-binding beta-propeller fold protein YncE